MYCVFCIYIYIYIYNEFVFLHILCLLHIYYVFSISMYTLLWVDQGAMWVPHLKRFVQLANAFLTFTEVADAQAALEIMNGLVAPSIAPTIVRVAGTLYICLGIYIYVDVLSFDDCLLNQPVHLLKPCPSRLHWPMRGMLRTSFSSHGLFSLVLLMQ